MNIVLVGCGKIGTSVITSLVAEGHNVVAIEKSDAVLSQITNVHDVMGVCGNGADCEVLREAGVDKAEMFVAVTDSDELNMLSCYLAKKLGARHTIARIRNPEYNDKSLGFMSSSLDISMAINPEYLAAREIYDILKLPSAVKIETFARRSFEMVEICLKEDSLLCGIPLKDLRVKFGAKFLICVVQRGDDVCIPDGNFVLSPGDKIGITASHTEILKLMREAGLLQKQARSVMIMGGGTTAFYLARMLLASGISVKILEQHRHLCRTLCEKLPKVVVINGDGTQQELLSEEGIDSTDAFVSLTGMDEENILVSIFAISQNVPKVITKVNRDELASLASKLGVDCVVSPKAIISDILVRYARALRNSLDSNVETLYQLMDGKVEALEFFVRDTNRAVTGITLKELELKPNTLIAGILRDRKLIIPSGDDMILAGDHVLVIAAGRRMQELTDILK